MGFVTKPVLMVDIVDFSTLSNSDQIDAVNLLIKLLNQAIPEAHNVHGRRIWSPAGDGGALTFWDDNRVALTTAVNLGKLMNAHNALKPGSAPMRLRIGLHAGAVTKEIDFDDRENIWGEGINIAARVAGLGKPGQIVASREYVEQADLKELPEPQVVSIGKWWAKHHKSLDLYNIYIDGAGIPPSEVDVWYGPFQYPLQQAADIYEAMLTEQAASREPGFRVAVLAKRLLDLDPGNRKAQEILAALSDKAMNRPHGLEHLYDKFLSPLPPSALKHFFSNARFRSFRTGETVVQEGDIANSMMMVVSGEIGVSIKPKGRPLSDLTAPGDSAENSLVFHEGDIIGEMGLFSPGGRRTATVKARKRAVMLELDYGFLQAPPDLPPGATIPPKAMSVIHIRQRIWDYYCQRMIANQLMSQRIFQPLSSSDRNMLAEAGEFLPTEHGQPVTLSPDDIWRFWIIVVSGQLAASALPDHRAVHYQVGDCLGPIHLVVSENPFARVEVAPGTQLIRFRWSRIRALIEESAEFRQACLISGGEDRLRVFPLA